MNKLQPYWHLFIIFQATGVFGLYRRREIRRRTRPMGTFSDHTSMGGIMFSVFAHENLEEGTSPPFLLLTQNI